MVKLYVYGYLHRLTSSRKPKREAGRNIELMWLTGKLVPDFMTITDFRHDNTSAIQVACQRFVAICRALGLFGGGPVGRSPVTKRRRWFLVCTSRDNPLCQANAWQPVLFIVVWCGM